MLAVAAIALGAALAASSASAGVESRELLPDLKPVAPFDLIVDGSPGNYVLGFASSAQNIGDAELKMRGSRPNTSALEMNADQLVQLEDGSEKVYEGAGTFVYVFEETHRHWHWQRFMGYELRRASNYELANPDRKSGFCVADRAPVPGYVGAASNFPDPTWCEQDNPDATELVVGLSVGWADPYDPLREGQSIEVTNLRAGKYYLVHKANPARLIRERAYFNNYSALLIRLTWPDGKNARPEVEELARCDQTGTPRKEVIVNLDEGATVCGLAGNDTVHAKAEGRQTVLGGPGKDALVSTFGGSILDGGPGSDTARYSTVKHDLVINLRNRVTRHPSATDTLISIENVSAGPGDDRIRGTRKRNVLIGHRGQDTIIAGAGNDVVRGGSGRDTLNGGAGADELIGGPGNDRIVSRDRARDVVSCGDGFDWVVADERDEISPDCEQVTLT